MLIFHFFFLIIIFHFKKCESELNEILILSFYWRSLNKERINVNLFNSIKFMAPFAISLTFFSPK